jgi:hypothetical protein
MAKISGNTVSYVSHLENCEEAGRTIKMATTRTTAARPLTVDEILGNLAPEKSKAVYTKAWNFFMAYLESGRSDVREADADDAGVPEGGSEAHEGGGSKARDLSGGGDMDSIPTDPHPQRKSKSARRWV